MTLNEYVDHFNEAPLDIVDFAESALDISDNTMLVHAAEEFLTAQEHFLSALEYHNVTIG